ncbi:MAG: integrase core domain-containing protein, partial [Planctomycetota bacterium]
RLLRETAIKEQIRPDQLTLHADRGAAMTSHPVSQLMASLGVSRSHSRLHTSNDNPYSESQFKKIKSHPDFPDRFEVYDHALDCSRRLIDWYNHHHRHWNLGLLTPAAVHTGAAGRILDKRRFILKEAYASHPERFVRGIPRPSRPAAEVWINPHENVAIRRAIQIPRDTDLVTQVSQSHLHVPRIAIAPPQYLPYLYTERPTSCPVLQKFSATSSNCRPWSPQQNSWKATTHSN